ncbi:hypothetical protein E0L35_09705 [Halomonas sp. ATBC28]|uniref:hypothetical protein n=1 Tax=Halomonas sp. ATBC28 TaxID=2545264 RepID=UPI00110E264E|nr:hypothetical protein [Halomonas sp. ATBC28]TMU24513.1 hypothetical protein E0L35_09705 [Halomonas sp. ATBC28]
MKHRSYKIEWAVLACAVLVALVSVAADYFYDSWNWFARSGAIVVLLAAVVEYRIYNHIYDDVQRAQFQQTKIDLSVPIKAKPTKERRRVSVAAHVLVILGTVIWGYGDLIWPQT